MKMSLSEAADILRKQKFKSTKPAERKDLPKYMIEQNWTEQKIDEFYAKQEKLCKALTIAITCVEAIKNFKKASYDIVDLFDNDILGEGGAEE